MTLFNRWITGIRLLEIPTEPICILFKSQTIRYMELWYTTWLYSSNKLRKIHESEQKVNIQLWQAQYVFC